MDYSNFRLIPPPPSRKHTLFFNVMASGELRLNGNLKKAIMEDCGAKALFVKFHADEAAILLEPVKGKMDSNAHKLNAAGVTHAGLLVEFLAAAAFQVPAHFKVSFDREKGLWVGRHDPGFPFRLPRQGKKPGQHCARCLAETTPES